MNTGGPGKVDARHLARTAYLDVRQSTLRQVTDNTESTRRQYGLRERASALGWPLHNPRYAGAFAFGRRRSRKRPEGGLRTTTLPREQWHALVRDAHAGYIGWQDYEQIQQRLRTSALAYGLEDRRTPPREGPALLQGLVVCGVCGSRMTVRYHARSGSLVPDYLCHIRTLQQREPPCQVIAGADIDAAVGEVMMQAMTPMAIEVTLAVQAELQTRLEHADRLRQQQVERAEHEAELARRRYMQVDPDNRLVASTLEAGWNANLRAWHQAHEHAERQRAADRTTIDDRPHPPRVERPAPRVVPGVASARRPKSSGLMDIDGSSVLRAKPR